MSMVIVYYSIYGHTQHYAEAIANQLNCPIYSLEEAETINLSSFETLIFGSALYIGKIKGKKFLNKHIDKDLKIFTVGLSDPEETNYEEIIEVSVSSQVKDKAEFFHFYGGMDFQALSFIDRNLMRMIKKMQFDKVPKVERSDNFKKMMAHYYDKVDFYNESAIHSLIESVK